jgi:hypothetical protein
LEWEVQNHLWFNLRARLIVLASTPDILRQT